jgi:uncharacterized protein (DUF1330 family)
MPVYISASIRIDDSVEYEKYQEGFLEIFDRYRGEILAVSDEPQVVEGDWPYTRAVLIRFPDEAEARNWYESEEYQKLCEHRWRASKAAIIAFEGVA